MKRTYRTVIAIAAIVALALVAAACGSSKKSSTSSSSSGGSATSTGSSSSSSGGKKIKVGLVTDIGGLNDRSFNHLAYVGLQRAQAQLGIQGRVLTSKSNADYVPNLTTLAQGHYDLIIPVGFLMADATDAVAKQVPTAKFAMVDVDATSLKDKLTNVEGLLFKEQEAGYLVGYLSGLVAKDKGYKTISSVGGQKIPPVDHYIAGFQWAMKMEDPSSTVFVDYSDDFTDPTKCADKATSQISRGADVVFQVAGGCGLGVLTTAQSKGVWSIGVDTDQAAISPSVIASAVKRVDTATYDAIKSVTDSSFKAGISTFSLANDGVGFVKGNIPIPADIQTEIDKVTADIKSGKDQVPDTVA